MSEIKLLTCPCCGSEAKLTTQRHREYKPTFAVRCTNIKCRLETPSDMDKNKVIDIWNTRKPIDRIVEQLEKHGQKMSEAKSVVPFGKCSSANHRYYKAISVKKVIKLVKAGGKSD